MITLYVKFNKNYINPPDTKPKKQTHPFLITSQKGTLHFPKFWGLSTLYFV